VADHVLVESLPGSDAEGEPAIGEDRCGRGGLRDDRRVVSDERAGHPGGEHDPVGARGDRGEDRPGEPGVAVVVQPGVEVIADLDEVEPDMLRADGLA
jgi:hypothetical protein